MNVLITGATGFIGGHLLRRLSRNEHYIVATYRNAPPDASLDVNWVKLTDLNDSSELNVIFSNHHFDVVVHLAALAHAPQIDDFEAYYLLNVEATRKIALACREFSVRRLVFISSIGAVCNESFVEVTENSTCRPNTPYGKSKYLAELVIKNALSDYDTDFVILRPSLVVGQGNPGNLEILGKIISKHIPIPSGIAKTKRSLIGVENLTEAIVKSMEFEGSFRGTYNLANDDVLTLREICEIIAKCKGITLRQVYIPMWMLRILAKMVDRYNRKLKANLPFSSSSLSKVSSDLRISNSKFKSLVGWRPLITTHTSLQHAFLKS